MTRAQRTARAMAELHAEMESDLGPNHDSFMKDDVGPPQLTARVVVHAIRIVPCGSKFAYLCTGCYATGKHHHSSERAQAEGDAHLAEFGA